VRQWLTAKAKDTWSILKAAIYTYECGWLLTFISFEIGLALLTSILTLPRSEYLLKRLILDLNSNYDYVITVSGSYRLNSLIDIKSSVQVYSESTPVRCEVTMQDNSTIYDNSAFMRFIKILDSNEAAISKNLALSYGIKQGDVLTVCTPISEEKRIFIISDILQTSFGFKHPDIDNGIIILGYASEIASNYSERNIFIKEKVFDEDFQRYFTQSTDIKLKADVIKETAIELIVIQFIACSLVLVGCCFFNTVYETVLCKTYYNKKLLAGETVKNIKREIKFDLMLINAPSLMIVIVSSFLILKIGQSVDFSVLELEFAIFQLLAVIVSYKIANRKLGISGGK
jgi:hypothetical protein